MNEAGDSASKQHTGSGAQTDRERDAELVERARAGDQAAFRQLFDLYNRRAYAVAIGVVKNPQDALDVVQDAFVKVHRHLDGFQGTSSFYTWLYRIVMNLAIDHVRKAKRARKTEYDDGVQRKDDELAGDGALMPRILDANPGKTALRKELTDALQAALDELPEHHRAVILLRELDGMSYEEMAETLDVPKGTIMSRLFHARRKMQVSLASYLGDDLDIKD